jgi:predicted CoA-binding protein
MDLSKSSKNAQKVLILGASDNVSRYSYRAFEQLTQRGYPTVLVNPRLSHLQSQPCYPSISMLPPDQRDIDTVTVYVAEEISNRMQEELLGLAPRRVIFNPGAENPGLAAVLQKSGIKVENACTLVLLSINQF